MSKETPATNVVKDSTFKGKRNNSSRPFLSDKDTAPYNDVLRYNEKKKEHILVAGISDEQKIAEGSMPPLQFQNATKVGPSGQLRQVGRFEKTLFERKEAARMKKIYNHRKKVEGLGSGGSVNTGKHHNEVIGTLIVHLHNFRRGKDYKDFKKDPLNTRPSGFKTTYSFPNVRSNEIFQVLSTIVRLDRNNNEDKVLNYVNKYYFDGKVYHGKAPSKQK